jgi:hypothetical protein
MTPTKTAQLPYHHHKKVSRIVKHPHQKKQNRKTYFIVISQSALHSPFFFFACEQTQNPRLIFQHDEKTK